MIRRSLTLLTTLGVCACATEPAEISTAYVSPLGYQNLSCSQIAAELERVTRRVTDLQVKLQGRADSDKGKMAIGMILFWPTLFFMSGDSPEAAEYSRLKGEREALEKVAVEKECRTTPTIVDVNQPRPVDGTYPAPTQEMRLQELKRLRDKGLISDEVYQTEQRRILSQ